MLVDSVVADWREFVLRVNGCQELVFDEDDGDACDAIVFLTVCIGHRDSIPWEMFGEDAGGAIIDEWHSLLEGELMRVVFHTFNGLIVNEVQIPWAGDAGKGIWQLEPTFVIKIDGADGLGITKLHSLREGQLAEPACGGVPRTFLPCGEVEGNVSKL